MNYKRIYEEFIADRLTKQPKDGEYYEVHHIRPRCMKGGDEPSNLIRLSASDHLFAHQLLARAYNNTEYAGNLWGAVLVLCRDALSMGRKGRDGKRLGSLSIAGVKGLKIRKSLDLARAQRVGKNSGLNSPSADLTTYTFRNKDGREYSGTRIEFCSEYGVSPGVIPRLMEDEYYTTRDGWYIVDGGLSDEERVRRADPTKYVFEHDNGVAKMRRTRRSFNKKTNIGWSAVHAIVDYGVKLSGWCAPESLKTEKSI